MHSPLGFVVVFLVARTTAGVAPQSSKGEACEHESFYCDSSDQSVFHRCLDGMYYTFTCPKGLHFSVKTQACDWPEQADCSFDYQGQEEYPTYDNNADYKSEVSNNNGDQSNDWSNYVVNNQPSSWISQAASSGKSWWRPANVHLDQLKDVSNINAPAHVVHIPDEKEDESDDEPKKSEKPKKSAKPKKSEKTKNSEKTKVSKPKKIKSTGNRKKPRAQTKVHSKSSAPQPERQTSGDLKWNDGECNPSNCQLPSCFCPGTSGPNGIPRSSTPQMVMITFDDEVSPSNYGYYQRLFRPGRYNPNGCTIKGCLFISGSGTIYDLVYPLYAMGMEIASHTISHRFPHTWWSTASYNDFIEEAAGMRENLVSNSGVPFDAIKGFRVPFLQLGSDNMYSALYDSKFTYESSMFTGSQWEGGEDPVWPFTLDYIPGPVYCQHGACPKKQYPGLWEIPVQRWYGLDGHSCAMPDGCSSTGDEEETLEYLKSNFRRYYNSNRAPMGIFVHARWFETEHNLDGLDRFIDYLQTLDDVYIVSPSQVIEWMRKPTPLSNIHNFGPWGCDGGVDEVWKKK